MRRFVCERYPIDQLPRDLHPRLPAGRQVRVIIEDDISDDDRLAELDRKIAKGVASLDAGISYSTEEVLEHLNSRFSPRSAAAE